MRELPRDPSIAATAAAAATACLPGGDGDVTKTASEMCLSLVLDDVIIEIYIAWCVRSELCRLGLSANALWLYIRNTHNSHETALCTQSVS